MRNIFYLLAALLSLGVGWFYYQEVQNQTATVTKLRLVAEEGLLIEAGTVIDDEFIETYIVSQPMPATLSEDFAWALSDDTLTRLNLPGMVFGQDVPAGSFLQRAHFFDDRQVDFDLRILPGHRAFSIPVEPDRGVGVFLTPGAHVDVFGPFMAGDNAVATRPLIENAIVMAVGANDSAADIRESDSPEYSNVTLQAPAEAVASFLALEVQSLSDLTLVLRNPCEGSADCVVPTQ